MQQTFTTNNGDIFTYTYDIHGRLINENILQEDTEYEYDNNDNKTKIGDITKTYDDLNIVITNIDLKFTRTYNSKNTNSDILGRGRTFGFSSKVEVNVLNSTEVYLPNGSINTFTKQSIYEYDSYGNLPKITKALGNIGIYIIA